MERGEASMDQMARKPKVYDLSREEWNTLVNSDVNSPEFQAIQQEKDIQFSDHFFFRVDGGDVRVVTGTADDFGTASDDEELNQSLLKQVE
ncbi:MAG: hypothetical protein HZC01_00560 [Candidatus Kerfeldbacteria bacterium]|nr:hypothetical protein [Candidatus Kerfeldbacteria bacterium]